MDTPDLLKTIETLPGVTRIKHWVGIHTQRLYVSFVQPRRHSTPQVVLDLSERKASTVAWPKSSTYNRQYGGSVDKLISLVEEWAPQTPEAPPPAEEASNGS